MPMKARKDLGFTLFCRSLITLPWKFWSVSYTTMFKKCATRQVWNVTFLMSCLFSVKILVRSLQARFQSTADVIILLAIKSDTTFSLDVYNFSTLFLVKLIFFSWYPKPSICTIAYLSQHKEKFPTKPCKPWWLPSKAKLQKCCQYSKPFIMK